MILLQIQLVLKDSDSSECNESSVMWGHINGSRHDLCVKKAFNYSISALWEADSCLSDSLGYIHIDSMDVLSLLYSQYRSQTH